MKSPVCPWILNARGIDAIVMGPGVIKTQPKSLIARQPFRVVYFEFIVLGRFPHMHYGVLNCYLG